MLLQEEVAYGYLSLDREWSSIVEEIYQLAGSFAWLTEVCEMIVLDLIVALNVDRQDGYYLPVKH